MLYDVLPPFIFFATLGGLIFVVGRVVMRMRRNDMSESLAAAAHDAPSRPTGVIASLTGLSSESADLTALLRPSHKGVRAITGRMGGAVSFFKNSGGSIRERVVNIKDHQPDVVNKAKDLPGKFIKRAQGMMEKRTKSAVEPVKTATEAFVASSVLPTTVSATVSKAKSKVAAGVLTAALPKVLVAPKATLSRKKPAAATNIKTAVLPPENQVPPPPQPAQATPVSTSAVTREPMRGFMAGSLLRRQEPAGIVEQAEELVLQEHYKAAEELLVPYIMKNPKDMGAYMLLGETALKQGSWDEALEIYEQLTRWQPPVKGAYAGVGFAAYRLGDFTRALQMLQRSLNEDPTNREVLETLLSLAQKMDNRGLQKSIREQLEALGVAPTAEQRERARV